jgi:hypothetical protein
LPVVLAPDQWSVKDVSEWLQAKELSQYRKNFEDNEISGKILLEISLQDLDYMGITVLAHRKIILKGVEELSSGRPVQVKSLVVFFHFR